MYVCMYVCMSLSLSLSLSLCVSLFVYIGDTRHACALALLCSHASETCSVTCMQRDMHELTHVPPRDASALSKPAKPAILFLTHQEQRRLTKRRTAVECISFGVGLLD